MPEQIYTEGPNAAPLKYDVPGSSEIIPLACHATFDGTGASGSFVPALVFRSQSGAVIARSATDTTLAAGESASVSWFPGVKSTTAGGTATAVDWCYIVTTGAIPSGTNFGPGTVDTISSFATSAPSLYAQVDANTWSTPGTPQSLIVWWTASALGTVTTNGTVWPLLTPGSGIVIPLDFRPTGIVTNIMTTSRMLTTGNQAQSGFRLRWGGADTHTWHAQIWMTNLVGTTTVN